MLDDAISEIFVQATLNTSGWEKELREASDRVNRQPKIRPGVDLSQLHELSKTLDIKQKHIKQVVDFADSNPIKPTVDTSGLDKELSRRIIVETEVGLKDLQGVRSGIGGILSKPFDIALAIPRNIAIGGLEGLGRSLQGALGGSISKIVNKKLGSTIGSLELLGNRLGEDIAEAAIERAGEYIKNSKSSFAKKIRGLDANPEALREFVGNEAVAIEVNQRRNKERLKFERSREQARDGVAVYRREQARVTDKAYREYKDADANYKYYEPRIMAALPKVAADLARVTPRSKPTLESATRYESKKNEIKIRQQEAKQQLATIEARQGKASKFNFDKDRSEQLFRVMSKLAARERVQSAVVLDAATKLVRLEQLPSSKTNQKAVADAYGAATRKQDALKIQLAELLDRKRTAYDLFSIEQKKLDTVELEVASLTNVPLPKFYQKRLDAIAPGIKRSQIPMLTQGVVDPRNRAEYRAKGNEIGMIPSILDRFKDGSYTEEDTLVLDEEIRHALDHDFGALSGRENIRAGRLDPKKKVKVKKTDKKFIQDVNRQLLSYPEDRQEIEFNAKLVAARAAEEFKNKRLVKELTAVTGLEGITLKNKSKLLDGIADIVSQQPSVPVARVRIIKKESASIAAERQGYYDAILDAQTTGMQSEKIESLIAKVVATEAKHDRLKAKMVTLSKRTKVKKYNSGLDDDAWADADQKRVRNLNQSKRYQSKPVQAELVLGTRERISVLAEQIGIAEQQALSAVPFDLGNKAKAGLQQIAGKGLSFLGDTAKAGLGGAAKSYSVLKGAEDALFSIAPWAAVPAKAAMQGAGTFALIGKVPGAQALLGGGMEALLGGGSAALGSAMGGFGGGAVGQIGGALAPLLAPALAGKTVANVAIKSIEAALPNDIKRLNKQLKEQQKQLTALTPQATKPVPTLAPSGGVEDIGTVRMLKESLAKGYAALSAAIKDGNKKAIGQLSASLEIDSSKAAEAVKVYYQGLPKDSPERKEAGAFNRFLGAKRSKFKSSLKQIELVPEEVASYRNDDDDENLASIRTDISGYIGKIRANRNERLIAKARLRAAKLDRAILGAESNEAIKSNKSALEAAEEVGQRFAGAKSIGITPIAKSLRQAATSRDRIVANLNKVGEVAELDDVPLIKSVEQFRGAEDRINKQLSIVNNLLGGDKSGVDNITSGGNKFAAAAVAFGAGILAIGVAVGGIKKAIARTSAEIALRTATGNELDYQESLAGAKAFSSRLGISATDQIKDTTRFRAQAEGTGLERLSDTLVQSTTVFGRARGANKEEAGRGLLALSQVASKPKLSAEELNQFEALPGFGALAATSNNYSPGQLRNLAAKGKIGSSDILGNLAPALTAKARIDEQSLSNNPQVQIDRLGASIENIQVSLGKGFLPGVASATDLAGKALEFLNNNLSILGTAGIVAIAGFVAQTITAKMAVAGFSGAVGLAKGAMTGLGSALTVIAPIAAITALIEISRALFDAYNGSESPTRKMVEEYEAAAAAVRGVKEAQGELNPIERVIQGAIDTDNFNRRRFGRAEGKSFRQIQAEGLEKEADKEYGRLFYSEQPAFKAIDGAGIEAANLAKKRLELEGKIADPLEPQAATAARAKRLQDINVKLNDLSLPLQQQKLALEAQIKAAEVLIKANKSDEATKATNAQLPRLKQDLAALNKVAGEFGQSVIAVDLNLERNIDKFSSYGVALERVGIEDAANATDVLAGSLYAGTKATVEFDNAQRQLQRQLSVSQAKAKEAVKVVATGEIGRTIGQLQQGQRLPKDLRDTSPEQFAKLKELGIDNSISDAIKFYNSSQAEIAAATNAQAKLLADRRTALRQEDKALRDNYDQTIASGIKSAEQIKAQTETLKGQNYAAALKTTIIGVSGATGTYIQGTIDIFNKLQELTTIQTDTAAKQSENAIKRIQAAKDRDLANQQYSGTSISVATDGRVSGARLADPVAGGRSLFAEASNRVQAAEAPRSGRDKHWGEDYSGKLGEPVRAIAAGRITEISKNVRWGKGGRYNSEGALSIESVMPDGGKLTTRYFHLGSDVGKAFKLGMNVTAGDIIGSIGGDGAPVGSGNTLHVDVKTRINGNKVTPQEAFRAYGAGSGAAAEAVTSAAGFTPTMASVYRPNSGKAIDGGPQDQRGKKLGDNDLAIATRLNGRKGGLPYGSIVRLRNPSTGKTVDVMARDTGGMGRGRGIDMTPAVAQALGMVADGVQPIQAAVISTPGSNAPEFALGDGDLFRKTDSKGALLRRLGGSAATPVIPRPQVTTINQGGSSPSPVIQQDFEAKTKQYDAESQAIVQQQALAIASAKIEARNLEFRRFQDTQRQLREEAATKRKGDVDIRLGKLSLGAPSSAKEQAKAQIENKFKLDENTIKQSQNREDYNQEVKEIARQEEVFKKFSLRTDLNPEQQAEVSKALKEFPRLKKLRKDLFNNVQNQITAELSLGKVTTKDLDKKRQQTIKAEDFAANRADASAGIGLDESLLAKAEEWLKANPYDYRYGDPLTIRKQIDLRKQKEDNQKKIQDLTLQLEALDPNAGNYQKSRAAINSQISKQKKEDAFREQNIRSNYDNSNNQRRLDKAKYATDNANTVVNRGLETEKLQAGYEGAQIRTTMAADRMVKVEAAQRNMQLEEQIANLKRAATLDPRLKGGLNMAIEEVKYQKKLLDYTAERVRWNERDLNLRNLTKQATESQFERRGLDIEKLTRRGNNYDARSGSGLLAKDKLNAEIEVKRRELLELERANDTDPSSPFYAETKLQLEAIAEELDTINSKKLDALNEEFSQFQAVINDTAKEGQRVLSDMLSGKGVDTNSLNQLLVAPFKAIGDQIASFLGGQWSQFVNDLMGGLVGGLNEVMGKAGSAESPSGGNIFSTIAKWIGGLFVGGGSSGGGSSGGGGVSLGNAVLGTLGGGGSFLKGFSDGGIVGAKSRHTPLYQIPAIKQALDKERRLSGGRVPELIVANRDEMVLTPAQTQRYLASQQIQGFSAGGMVSGLSQDLEVNRFNYSYPSPAPLKLQTEIINGIETVSIEQLNVRLTEMDKRNRRGLEEYFRAQDDRMTHNVGYRRGLGLT